MIVDIESDANGLQFVGLTPFGHKLVQVSYDNQAATATAMPDKRLDPAMLVAMLQFALWPSDAVRAGLSSTLTLEESDSSRRILSGGNALLTVSHTGTEAPYKQLHLVIPSVGLELDIEDLGPRTPVEQGQ
jgi:hypothetical protein